MLSSVELVFKAASSNMEERSLLAVRIRKERKLALEGKFSVQPDGCNSERGVAIKAVIR